MKSEYYGDKRDLVKWGTLLVLAKECRARRILQVAYFRTTVWGKLYVDKREEDIPKSVLDCFRNIRNIENLSSDPRIEVMDSEFTNREQYQEEIVRKVSEDIHPSIVFLDPDTGLEPKEPCEKHVRNAELPPIWERMVEGDVLAVYQHQTNRNGQSWIDEKREQFEKALKLPPGCAKTARGPKIAGDVVLFYCLKSK